MIQTSQITILISNAHSILTGRADDGGRAVVENDSLPGVDMAQLGREARAAVKALLASACSWPALLSAHSPACPAIPG